jgi:hypothetical protein
LVWGAALVANCGGSSDGGTGNPTGGSGGDAGESPSAGKNSTAGDSVTAGTAGKSAGGTSNGGTTSGGTASGGVPAEAGQSAGGESTAGGAAGMSVGGESAAGADAGGAGGEASVPVSVCPATIDKYPEVFAKAVCEKRVDCCTSDLDTCMKDETDALAALLPDLLKSKQDGIAAADCKALDKCVAAIKAGKCEDWPTELGESYGIPVEEPACRQWITPKLQPLDACSANYQCVNGWCNAKKCSAFVADGATCGGAGQLCNLTTSFCDTTVNKCTPRLADGAACTAKGQCASRVCDTAGTKKCIAPGPTKCEYVPAGCSFSGMPRDSLGWSLIVGALALGTALRRRRAAR